MFTMTVTPRFYETDALGHINNTVISNWFEAAREPVFRLFNPGLDLERWNIILARVAIDYVAQTHYGKPVEVRTFITRLGSSSFVVSQEGWQDGVLVARGEAVQVYFNYATQKSEPIPASYRALLEQHLQPAG